ncbi:cobalamin B12-binding domain-containing protein [Metabacillus sp. 113a]|uniref:cobalamin B12-binding domain-containing protein n=1 Tax=Metabacillus sp. 113a TaxID=3404706 RepID=UPI003CECC18C
MNIQVEELSKLLLDGKVMKAWTFLQSSASGKNTMEFYDMIKEAMYHIGELWEENRITVAEEHVASHVCKNLLSYKYYHSLKQTYHVIPLKKKKAMFFCVEGEEHDLGVHIVSNYFHENGWDTQCLGRNLKLEHALQFAEKFKPEVIGISVNIVYNLPLVNKYIEVLEELPFGPVIMVGGKLAASHDLEFHCPPGTMIIRSLTEIEDLINYTGTVQHGNAINV